ncbi:hypothetical protein B0A54_14957, partial [Friedmanniomyces endolithicus]
MAGVLVDVEVANVDGVEVEVTDANVEVMTEVVAVVLVDGTQVPPTSIEDASHRIVETTGKTDVTGARIDVTPRSPPVEVEGTQVPPTSTEDAPQRIVETTGKIDVTGARIDVMPSRPPVEVEGTQVPPTSTEDAPQRIVETT